MYACIHTYIHTYIHAYNLGLESQTRNFAWLTLLTLQWASLMLVRGIVATKAVPHGRRRARPWAVRNSLSCVKMYRYIYTHIHTHTNTQAQTLSHTHTHTHTGTLSHTRTCTHTHTHTHTHTKHMQLCHDTHSYMTHSYIKHSYMTH